MPTTHDLKSRPENFRRFLAGTRDSELRVNDRNFGLGDGVLLREFKDTPSGEYTGRTITMKVLGVQPVLIEDANRVEQRKGVVLTYEMVGTDIPARKARRAAPRQFVAGQIFEFPAADGGEAFRIRCDGVDDKGKPTTFSPI